MEQNESGLFRHLRLELIEENTGNKYVNTKLNRQSLA